MIDHDRLFKELLTTFFLDFMALFFPDVMLRLDPARMQLISGFVDTYLELSREEEERFREEIGRIEPEVMEGAMEIVTSWMRQGIEQGLEQGLDQGRVRQVSLVLRLLNRRVGILPETVEAVIRELDFDALEDLGEALLDFERLEALVGWLLRDEGRAVALLERVCGEALRDEVRSQLYNLSPDQQQSLSRILLTFKNSANLEQWLTTEVTNPEA